MVAKDVLETLRKPGGTKNFAVIQGYIPKKMEKNSQIQQNNGPQLVEEITDPEMLNKFQHLDNPKWVRTFEVITNSQGIPRRQENMILHQ